MASALHRSYAKPPARRRRSRLDGRVFYTTALIITLFACYSFLRGLGHDVSHRTRAVPRALIATASENLECRFVHNAADQCAFVQANCPDEEAGLISYLQFYYCRLPAAKPLAFTVLVVWASLLFSTIGIAASDFLCINLSTIASILGMSESLTGVTFLAFGNGSPDVFSTFAAMGSNSGSLAIGELLGAACFITAVVAGSMALVKPFQVARKSFVRDVGFFAVAASFSLVFLSDGKLRLWECAAMIAFYACYVAFVVGWHWWMARRRTTRLAEQAARLQHHIPGEQELDFPEYHDDEESRPASERSGLFRAQSGETIPTLVTPGTPAWTVDELDDDDEERDRRLAELQSKMRVSRAGRGSRRNTMTPIRPSLIGALEFRSVLNALEKRSTIDHYYQPINLRRYSDDASGRASPIPVTAPAASHPDLVSTGFDETARNSSEARRIRAGSANDAQRLKIDTNFLAGARAEAGASGARETPRTKRASASILAQLNEPSPQTPKSPKLVLPPPQSDESFSSSLSTEQPKSPSLLAPPPTVFHRPDYDEERGRDASRSPAHSPRAGPTLQVPILHIPHPDHSKGLVHNEDFPPYMDSPMVLTPAHSRAPSIRRLSATSISPESTRNLGLLPDEEEEPLKTFKWWPYQYLPAPQVIVAALFPTVYDWGNKSWIDKILGVLTAPTVFLLSITLPVVEPKEEDQPDPDPGLLDPVAARARAGTTNAAESSSTPSVPTAGNGPPHSQGSGISRQMSDAHKTPNETSATVEEAPGLKDWNRWLVFVQLFTAPLFVVTIFWANVDEEHNKLLLLRLILGSLVFSLVCLLILLATTTYDKEPKYRPLLCFLGFAVAIAWISTIANEVVGILKAFGVILGISDAILGLTIFAVGNSLGDLVADITVAKLGFPVMALSACFGGPMLNILLGIGISGVYMTITNATHRHSKHPNKPIKYKPYEIDVSTTLFISGITLVVTLIGLLIVVPLNGWRMDRKIGLGLIAVWTISTTANVVVEILGYGHDWAI